MGVVLNAVIVAWHVVLLSSWVLIMSRGHRCHERGYLHFKLLHINGLTLFRSPVVSNGVGWIHAVITILIES